MTKVSNITEGRQFSRRIGDRVPRKGGQLKGLPMPDSFLDPLPEEELTAWEGAHSFRPGDPSSPEQGR